MLPEKGPIRTALLVVSAVYLGFALFANLPKLHKGGFLTADQSVYYSMAQSLAFDGDLEYTAQDLIRFYNDFEAGPNGIFLKKVVRDGRERLYYAKAFAYPLVAAPFVRVFGPNGPLVLNAVLLFLLLLMGWSYFALKNSAGLSLFKIVTFLGASAAIVYWFWITPEFLNLFLVFTVLFLWRYKAEAREAAAAAPAGEPKPLGPGRRFLMSGGSDFLAAALAGIVIYAKPPNLVLTAPLFLSTLFVGKKFWKAVALGLVMVLVAAVLFAANWAWTSEWNYQGGQRKSFALSFPFEKHDATFDSLPGARMTADGYAAWKVIPAKFVPYNLYWYVFGRFTGVAWYFFPALLYLILFFLGKKSLDRWLILAAAVGQILVYVFLMPDNYGGGGGSLANRYFMNIFPLFLFLPGGRIRKGEIVVPWLMAAVFLSPFLLAPIESSSSPSMHAKRFPFTLLPLEYTLINDIPTNTTTSAHRQKWGDRADPLYEKKFIYFLDDNYHEKHPNENGWWTRDDERADMVLRTFFPVKEVVVHLLNNHRDANTITVTLDGKTQKVVLGYLERRDLRFPVGNGFQISESHQYRFKVKASKGALPSIERPESDEERTIGVFFELEVVPR